jgi:hypothetical protein
MGREDKIKEKKEAKETKQAAKGAPGAKIKLGWTMKHVLLTAILILLGNWMGPKITPWSALPGMLILLAVLALTSASLAAQEDTVKDDVPLPPMKGPAERPPLAVFKSVEKAAGKN